ncbi:MAG: hypothetical protein WBD87_00495 [Candidatus Acidiferrales bacterium]
MALPKTKEETLLHMRLIWFAFLMSIPLYIYAGMLASFSWLNIRNSGIIFDVLGVLDLLYFGGIRISLYARAREAAQGHSDDIRAVRRWMVFWIVLLSSAEAEALFGVCLQVGNNTLRPALPFFVVAFLLLLTLWPRQIWSPGITATGRENRRINR